MLVRASSESGGSGGNYEIVDISSMSANSRYDLNLPDTTNCIVSVTCPSSNNVYIYGGLFQAESGTITTLKANTNQQVKLNKNNGNLVISTTLATAAGKALIVYT